MPSLPTSRLSVNKPRSTRMHWLCSRVIVSGPSARLDPPMITADSPLATSANELDGISQMQVLDACFGSELGSR